MKKINAIKFVSWIILILCICSLAISTCSDNKQENIKIYLQQEFIETYKHVIDNNSMNKDISNQFDKMVSHNSDAFSSVAYRWHFHAMDLCKLSMSNHSQSRESNYEKMLQQNFNEINPIAISSIDRDCLAKIYISHWSEINNMLALNFSYMQITY